MTDSCSTCRFWKPYSPADGSPPAAGLCRALPPLNAAAIWPDTRALDWCGFHAAPAPLVEASGGMASTSGAAAPAGAEAVPGAGSGLDAGELARRLRADGLTLRAVGERLAAVGVVSPSGRPLAPASVARLAG